MTQKEELQRQHEEDLRRIRNFRLMDDDFMTACFEGAPACVELVLRIILNKPDLRVVDVCTQVFVVNLLKRAIRLDILAIDGDGVRYNIEIQRSDQGADPKRARFHSSLLDAKWTEKGTSFGDLPETYTIFITESDVLGDGQPVYQIERCILKSGKMFCDGAHILYVNGACQGDTPLGKLMHDFFCTTADEMHYDVLAERVRYFKEHKEGVAIMCKAIEEMRAESFQAGMEKGMKRGMKEGMQKGVQKERNENVKKLLLAGMAPKQIAEIFGLSYEKVLTIRAELNLQ